MMSESFATLREKLSRPDQVLLILRVDKEWKEVAAALADEELAADDLEREAERLRERLQLVTDLLRDLRDT
jgi:hypothetical protein